LRQWGFGTHLESLHEPHVEPARIPPCDFKLENRDK